MPTESGPEEGRGRAGAPRPVDPVFSRYRALLGPLVVVCLFVVGMFWSPFEPHPLPADPSGASGGEITWSHEDWSIFEERVEAAVEAGADTLPMGELMVHVGLGLVGTPYEAGTLEVEGPERLVVELGSLDCVTFVENVYAISAAVKAGVAQRLDDRATVEGEYERMLRALRYRGNVIDGYPSRLHYFSEWIHDAEAKQLVEDVTDDLGGVVDREPLRFMSENPEAYRQLSEPENLAAIRRVEDLLSRRGRHVIPEDRIEEVSSGIRNGDIIAATSSVYGLDVAHTGIAVRIGDALHLIHAPLVGDSVEVSERRLAERIQAIDGQDGIIVARPLEPRAGSAPVGRRNLR
ncbi:MAG: DUF1460 domain-containing protein [Longimicrobiales bacterium]|nr:DUF1460 domain-containing protein [Longimicrobiales bacterium]